MTRSVADAALVLSVIAGRDELDDTSLAAPLDDYPAAIDGDAKGIHVGVQRATDSPPTQAVADDQ